MFPRTYLLSHLGQNFLPICLPIILLSLVECMDEFFLHEGKCVQECPSHFYPEDKHCFPCHADCKDCNGPHSDDCTACTFSWFILYNGMCFEDCPEGSYYEEATKDCQGWQLLLSSEEYWDTSRTIWGSPPKGLCVTANVIISVLELKRIANAEK